MAVGEAGCASVHGANRLGSNSLIDLVVFGRAAAHPRGEVVDPSSSVPDDLNEASIDNAMARFDELRHADGATPTAELRLEMQKTMQADAAVFRTRTRRWPRASRRWTASRARWTTSRSPTGR
jgi:succinate dehydrogenase / fumarate reductase flavoprotein subunit